MEFDFDNKLPLGNVDYQKKEMGYILADPKKHGIADFTPHDYLTDASKVYAEYIGLHKQRMFDRASALRGAEVSLYEFNKWFNSNSYVFARVWLDAWVSCRAYSIEQDI